MAFSGSTVARRFVSPGKRIVQVADQLGLRNYNGIPGPDHRLPRQSHHAKGFLRPYEGIYRHGAGATG